MVRALDLQLTVKSSNPCNTAIFRIGGCRHHVFLFKYFSLLTVGMVKSAELRHHAQFYRNRSNCGRDIAFFAFFKMAAAVILNFKNYKFLTVGYTKKVLHCAKLRMHCSNPGRHMVICYYSTWRLPPSWMFEISHF